VKEGEIYRILERNSKKEREREREREKGRVKEGERYRIIEKQQDSQERDRILLPYLNPNHISDRCSKEYVCGSTIYTFK
jgi:hypothetical protein